MSIAELPQSAMEYARLKNEFDDVVKRMSREKYRNKGNYDRLFNRARELEEKLKKLKNGT